MRCPFVVPVLNLGRGSCPFCWAWITNEIVIWTSEGCQMQNAGTNATGQERHGLQVFCPSSAVSFSQSVHTSREIQQIWIWPNKNGGHRGDHHGIFVLGIVPRPVKWITKSTYIQMRFLFLFLSRFLSVCLNLLDHFRQWENKTCDSFQELQIELMNGKEPKAKVFRLVISCKCSNMYCLKKSMITTQELHKMNWTNNEEKKCFPTHPFSHKSSHFFEIFFWNPWPQRNEAHAEIETNTA